MRFSRSIKACIILFFDIANKEKRTFHRNCSKVSVHIRLYILQMLKRIK